MAHHISKSCSGENCAMCPQPKPATHKVGEEILEDDPNPIRHNLTAYVCCEHFGQIFGPTARERCAQAAV